MALIISTIVLSLLLTAIFTSLSINQTNEISTRMLSRLVMMTEQVYEDAYSVILALGYGENIDINTMMFGNSRDRLRDYAGHSRMRLMQTIYQNIAYIGVYNGTLDVIMCTLGLEKGTEASIRQSILDNYSSQGSRVLIPMKNQKIVTKGFDPNLNTLTLIYYSPLSTRGQIGAIFLAIDCTYLSQFISTINEQGEQLTFLVNSDGLVLSHPDKTQILLDYKSVDYVQTALSSKKATGYFFTKYLNERTLATYKRGTDLDWTYITLTPYKDILNKINTVFLFTIISSLLIVILGALFSLFAAQKTFNPIAKLLTKAGYSLDVKASKKTDEIKYLDDQFAHYIKVSSVNEAMLMNFALESLLKGELTEETAALLQQNESSIHALYYMVCPLCINKTDNYRDLARKDKNMILFTLARIAQDCLLPLCDGAHPVNMSSNSVAIIMQLSSGVMPEGIILALAEVQKIFTGGFSLTFTASISSVYEDLYALQDACEEAIQLINERFFTGGNIILPTQVRSISNEAYDHRLENELWLAIRENNDDKIIGSVGKFTSELRTLSYKYARLFISQLSINLLSESLALLPQMEMEQFNIYKRNLDNVETLDQAHDVLLQFCRRIAIIHNGPEDTEIHHSIDQSIHMAKTNYMDASFSTNTVAKQVNLSIVYFNRIFKKRIGQSYSTYLNNYRLNMACSLLRTTNLQMSRICGNVGLSNESYFYALFKKEYGITPQQYRSKYGT